LSLAGFCSDCALSLCTACCASPLLWGCCRLRFMFCCGVCQGASAAACSSCSAAFATAWLYWPGWTGRQVVPCWLLRKGGSHARSGLGTAVCGQAGVFGRCGECDVRCLLLACTPAIQPATRCCKPAATARAPALTAPLCLFLACRTATRRCMRHVPTATQQHSCCWAGAPRCTLSIRQGRVASRLLQ
jgi:hypothetical protein